MGSRPHTAQRSVTSLDVTLPPCVERNAAQRSCVFKSPSAPPAATRIQQARRLAADAAGAGVTGDTSGHVVLRRTSASVDSTTSLMSNGNDIALTAPSRPASNASSASMKALMSSHLAQIRSLPSVLAISRPVPSGSR
jgi:hypothetical protein